jgi:DNA-binding NtrC family response regulator
MTAKKILMVDDELESIWRFTDVLTSKGYSVSRCADPKQAVEVFLREKPDAVLLDVKMPGRSGFEVLKEIRDRDQHVCVIMLSAYSERATVVEALKLKADNFADKGQDTEGLLLILEKELRTKDLEAQLRGLKRDNGGGLKCVGDIVGESEVIKAVKRQIRQYAEYAQDTSTTIFITGDSGVGKNVVAEALHTQSERRAKPFKHMLCSNLQPQLVESELFGYERGAFTDAYRSKKGLIEAADGGTVFLDEIGTLTPDIQAKLLLLVDTGVYFKLGGEGVSKTSEAWFITATNLDIPTAMRDGRFRQDLYYRLNQAWIHVPSLKERGDDVILLAEYFIKLESEKLGRSPVALKPEYMDKLLSYRWPGNVRQLQSVIRRYVRTEGADERLYSAGFENLPAGEEPGDGAHDLKAASKSAVEAIEKKRIGEALARFGGNRTKAAKWLGISRRSLMYKIKKYGLTRRD